MFERKTFTIYPTKAIHRPVYVRASSRRDAISSFADLVGLIETDVQDVAGDSTGPDVTHFTIGTGATFHVYESQPNELAELGAAS